VSLLSRHSPVPVSTNGNREIAWANEFLDAQKLRQLSVRSLRAYGFDLVHAARWFQTTGHSLSQLNQSLLLQYVRYQLEQQPSPTPQTINHRLCVLCCLYRFHYGLKLMTRNTS
jgi:site-specific recombinase XerD